jgi:copper resistance protein B
LLWLTTTSTAFAQDHSHHAMPEPAAKDHSEHTDETRPSPAKGAESASSPDHAAMGHGAASAPTQPHTPIPPVSESDRAAAWAPLQTHAMHDTALYGQVLFDRFEGFDGDHGNGLEWEGQAWYGSDLNKLWLRSEGERTSGELESGELEVLYGRALSPWWEGMIGIRHDFKPGASQDFLAFGASGTAPYKIEIEATAYFGESGQTAARVEFEYEALLSQRWILQPVMELNLHGKDDQRRGIGSGLSTIETGLRLRYEINRQFAPYLGVTRERAFGHTADFRREEGEGVDDTRAVFGVRFWF